MEYPPWDEYTGSERRHYPKGPKIFDAMCGVDGIYMSPYWNLVTCKCCVTTRFEELRRIGPKLSRIQRAEMTYLETRLDEMEVTDGAVPSSEGRS